MRKCKEYRIHVYIAFSGKSTRTRINNNLFESFEQYSIRLQYPDNKLLTQVKMEINRMNKKEGGVDSLVERIMIKYSYGA